MKFFEFAYKKKIFLDWDFLEPFSKFKNCFRHPAAIKRLYKFNIYKKILISLFNIICELNKFNTHFL